MVTKRIKVKKLKNTRDLGDLITSDGRKIAHGKLIRSGRLSDLPTKSVCKLKEIGISTIVDLRIPAEKNDHPDIKLPESRYVWLPVTTTPTETVVSEETMYRTMKKEGKRLISDFASDFDAYMIETYRTIVFADESRDRLRRFIRILLEEDGCVLWHCNSGKDRAGICSMLIEALLGVDEQTIYDDYLISRKYWRAKYRMYRLGIAVIPGSGSLKKMLYGMMRLKKVYLETVIEEMKAKYGSIIGYCKEELGVTDGDISLLRAKYLV